jgi:ribosomal protein S12 methylthiotransferase
MEKDRRFLPYFDIPFQHASEKILRAMNRRGNASRYLELIKIIRTRLPEAVIRSSFLLGFPGEKEEDFEQLLDFQEKAAIDWLGCFVFSREEGTAAYSMKERIPKKTAEMRKKLIEERQIRITENNMDRFVNTTLDVLIEEQIDEEFALGRLYCQAPEIDGAAVITGNEANEKMGSLVSCKVLTRRGFDLEVKLINSQ